MRKNSRRLDPVCNAIERLTLRMNRVIEQTMWPVTHIRAEMGISKNNYCYYNRVNARIFEFQEVTYVAEHDNIFIFIFLHFIFLNLTLFKLSMISSSSKGPTPP